MPSGKLIVIYGVNALGKSTQVKLLEERVKDFYDTPIRGTRIRKVLALKYPIYGLEPSGALINGYLREGNPYRLNPMCFQTLQALNRTHYEPTLRAFLDGGGVVIAEDYVGTSLAWGIVSGVSKEYLLKLNSHLRKEDIAILLHGEYFSDKVEKGHVHESSSDLMERCAKVHYDLAIEFGWHIVGANRHRDEVSKDIWSIVYEKIKKKTFLD